MDEYIEQPVRLGPGILENVVRKRGTLNAAALSVAGTECEPCSVVFLGFAGTKHEDGSCTGAYRFREARTHSDAERDTYDHRRLPGWPAKSLIVTA
jgi:hypothetical protein